MHPILARTARLGLYLLAWIPLAAIVAVLLVLAGSFSWLEAALVALPLCLVYAFLCLSSWYLCKVFPLGSTRLGAMAGTYAVAAVVGGFLWVLWATTVGSVLALIPDFASLPERLPRAAPVVFLLGVVFYLMVVALHYVVFAFENVREREKREAELIGLAREAELKVLKDQLNPHFLFNSLNAVSALTASDPARAREMCVLLSDFLRATLGLTDRISIPLKEEIALAHNYLAVEQVRFGNRLRVEEELDPSTDDCPIPPLLLQPLVENAVRHGIASSLKGGLLKLTTSRAGQNVTIVLENPVDPAAVPVPGAGVGLKNVRRRIAARWGESASMRERNQPDLFRIEISIPAEAVT